jgi:hypothetical protein
VSSVNSPHPLLVTAASAAACAGLSESELKALEPDGFGSPGHWRMAGNNVVYTERGLEALVEACAKRGFIHTASALYGALVNARQERDTPSRALAAPGPKSSDLPEYEWQRRADIAG